MEYHDQPLQFINTHFIQVKDRNAGEYLNIKALIDSFVTFPLLGMPIVAYLTSHYIYPKIYDFIGKYAEYLSIDPSSTYHVVLKHVSPGVSSLLITFLLLQLHSFSSFEFVKYGNEILHDDDLFLPYLHVACSWLAIIGLYATCIAIAVYFYKTKKEDINEDKVINHLIASIIALNIIYIVCYFSPFMLLAFIRDPLVTTLTYCMIMVFIFTITWLEILLCKQFENCLVFTGVYKALFILTSIALFISFNNIFVTFIIFVSSIIALGSFNDFQSLQTLLLSLLVGLVSFSIAKPVYEKACKHVNVIKKSVSVEEQKEIPGNIPAKGPTNTAATNILKTEDGDMNNNKTEGLIMSIDNKNDGGTLV